MIYHRKEMAAAIYGTIRMAGRYEKAHMLPCTRMSYATASTRQYVLREQNIRGRAVPARRRHDVLFQTRQAYRAARAALKGAKTRHASVHAENGTATIETAALSSECCSAITTYRHVPPPEFSEARIFIHRAKDTAGQAC